MKKNFKISIKQLTIILVLIFFIIMSESLKFLLVTKDLNLAKEFIRKSNYQLTDQSYILLNMIEYFFSIINYIILALFTYFTKDRLRISGSYKAVYVLMILLSLLYKFMMRTNFNNYVSIILQVILLLYVLNLKKGDNYE